MPIDNWLAFVAASAIMLAIPGPTVVLIMSYALSHGRKPAFSAVAGVGLGGLVAITVSLLGLGALLAASSTVFSALKWIGGAYLVYLGIKLWRTPIAISDAVSRSGLTTSQMIVHAFVVTALNPKGIVFFVAFVPQFMAAGEPFWPQATVLIATFVVLDILNCCIYALVASTARKSLREPRVQRIINRTGGSLLIGAGALAAGWRKAGA